MIDLSGEVAVVTGASRGIGREVAKKMADAGADVIGISRDEDALASLAKEIEDEGQVFRGFVADLMDHDAAASAIQFVVDAIGVPTILVNGAGVISRESPFEIGAQQIDDLLALNVRACFLMCRETALRMKSSSGGAIINVASLAAEVVTGTSAIYSGSKAAVLQMSRVFAANWGPRIRVNAIGPGYVETDLNRDWLGNSENRDYVIGHTALGKLGTTDDIANVVLFMASSLASHITGQHIVVDGGWIPGN